MRKLHSNEFGKMAIVAACLAMVLGPSLLWAHPEDELLTSYCTRLLIFEVENDKKIDAIESSYASKETIRINEIAKIRIEQDEELGKSRNEVHEAVEKTFSRIEPGIPESEIGDVKGKFETAKNEYDKAVDEAIITYRNGINNEMEGRKASFVSAKHKFEAAVKAILSKAKKDCESRSDVNLIFTGTTTSLKKVHEDFKAAIRGLDSIDSNLNKLGEARNEEVKAAQDKLKTDIGKVIADLENSEI